MNGVEPDLFDPFTGGKKQNMNRRTKSAATHC